MSKPHRIPTSGRDFTYSDRERHPRNHDLGTGKGAEVGGGVAMPPPIIFRAPLAGPGKPEGAGRPKKQ